MEIASKLVNALMADAWKDMQPKIELHKWPDVAHWPMIDVPHRVARVIRDRYWRQERPDDKKRNACDA